MCLILQRPFLALWSFGSCPGARIRLWNQPKIFSIPMNLHVGDEAPNFTLPDQDGKTHELTHYRGQWVLLYFYPKDDTPGCTKEACAIRDRWADFKKADAQVFGISTDSVKSHGKFAA